MTIEALKQELAGLPGNERSKIMAFLVALQDRDDAASRAELARKIDDGTPEHWLKVDEANRRFGLDDEPKS
jgi:hypothetical protein